MMVPGCFLLHEIATGLAGVVWSEDDQSYQSTLGGNLAYSQYGFCVALMGLALSVHPSIPWCGNAMHRLEFNAGLLPFPTYFAAVLQLAR